MSPASSPHELRSVSRPDRVRYVIAVASGKGGVGKSTVAAALAVSFLNSGKKVGLLDADLAGPSLPALFAAHNLSMDVIDERYIVPITLSNGLHAVSFGFLLGDSPAIMRGPMVSRYIGQMLLDVRWPELDILIIDLPPGTNDVHLTVTQTIALDGSVVVTTPQALSYSDVGKALLMFDAVQVPVIGLVENMSGILCPACGERSVFFAVPQHDGRAEGRGGAGAGMLLSERFGLPLLANIDIDPLLCNDITSGGAKDTRRAIEHIGARIWDFIVNGQGKKAAPTIENTGDSIRLLWPDNTEQMVDSYALRSSCRCAICVDEHSGATRYDNIPRDVRAQEVRPIGNYALYIQWSDGHYSGFFTYRAIDRLAPRKAV